MLYKNKIKAQNILKSAVALMLMLTLSLSTALSPLAKAEEAEYTWKTLTTMPAVSLPGELGHTRISPDGSKLFAIGRDAVHSMDVWMSADDGATWRKIFTKQTATIGDVLTNADGSKIVVTYENSFSISTDGGQSWVERGPDPIPDLLDRKVVISPDGSFLANCYWATSTDYVISISTDDGQTWTRKGDNKIGCPNYAFNNGTLIVKKWDDMARSTDYGQTWTERRDVLDSDKFGSFSNNGNTMFEGDRISLDGGNSWTPLNPPIPAGRGILGAWISDDGKKMAIRVTSRRGAINHRSAALLTSVDGGRTWHSEEGDDSYLSVSMPSDGSKVFYMYDNIYRLGTLTTPQPVTPGSGAGGAVTPSTGSTSAAPGQKPGKASGRLAETGTSTWMVGGLAVIAVAAGALVLRKRL